MDNNLEQFSINNMKKQSISLSLKKSREALERMISKLSLLSSHNALYLLRNCFHIPKFLHILRTSPAFAESGILQDMDSLTAEALSKFLNVEIHSKTWQQITLPTKYGGLGIPSIKYSATSALIASAMSSVQLCSTQSFLKIPMVIHVLFNLYIWMKLSNYDKTPM